MTVPPALAGQCPICRLAEEGLGYAPPAKRKIKPDEMVFTCEAHIGLAKGWAHMPSKIRNRIEAEALTAATDQAADYLTRIGKIEALSALSADEAETMFAVFLERFGAELSERVGAGVAPF